ncbi:hypothetical protein HW555_005138 [Spodoptera exigua]|uniref:Peptidase A2 domain-containing protein n=1 Tax=Spodoptera exigua TaxID=7107 RepID=A0A835L4W9_SPOEX|nr:hypothetical protein HW555_005138 [Spodoptera exigua]
MESRIARQSEIISSITTIKVNFNKDSDSRKNAEYIKKRLGALDALWEEFEQNHSRISDHASEADEYFRLNTYQPNIQKQSSSEIKRLYDTTTECIHAIHNLGVNTNAWDPLLVHLLCKKLDTDTQTDYREARVEPRKLPKLDELMTFLEVDDEELLLTTLSINVRCSDGTYITLRALLDQGSQISLISENAVQRLGLQRRRYNASCPV